MSWQGAAVGALGLCLLEVALTSNGAVTRLGGLTTTVGPALARITDPNVPLFGPASTAAAEGDAVKDEGGNTEGGGEGPAPTTPAPTTVADTSSSLAAPVVLA